MNNQENHCWYHLNIEVNNALNHSWEFPNVTGRRHMWGYAPHDILDQEWINMMMNKYGLDINYVILFYSDSYFSGEAHVDIDSRTLKPCIFAMNWVINCEGSEMLWYERPNQIKELKITKDTKTGYESWNYRTLNQIDKCITSDKLSLVRVDIPHRTVSDKNKRWCISARVKNINLTKWNSTVEYFKSKNLIINRD